MSQNRRRFTPESKAQIVRRHLADKEPVSKLAEEFQVQPSQIHNWVNLVLAQAEKAFDRSTDNARKENSKDQRRIEHLFCCHECHDQTRWRLCEAGHRGIHADRQKEFSGTCS